MSRWDDYDGKKEPKASFRGSPKKGEKSPKDIQREASRKKEDSLVGQIRASWRSRRMRIWGNKP